MIILVLPIWTFKSTFPCEVAHYFTFKGFSLGTCQTWPFQGSSLRESTRNRRQISFSFWAAAFVLVALSFNIWFLVEKMIKARSLWWLAEMDKIATFNNSSFEYAVAERWENWDFIWATWSFTSISCLNILFKRLLSAPNLITIGFQVFLCCNLSYGALDMSQSTTINRKLEVIWNWRLWQGAMNCVSLLVILDSIYRLW